MEDDDDISDEYEEDIDNEDEYEDLREENDVMRKPGETGHYGDEAVKGIQSSDDEDPTAEDTAGYSAEDSDIYSEDGMREQALQDEIEDWEEGFMQGHEDAIDEAFEEDESE